MDDLKHNLLCNSNHLWWVLTENLRGISKHLYYRMSFIQYRLSIALMECFHKIAFWEVEYKRLIQYFNIFRTREQNTGKHNTMISLQQMINSAPFQGKNRYIVDSLYGVVKNGLLLRRICSMNQYQSRALCCTLIRLIINAHRTAEEACVF